MTEPPEPTQAPGGLAEPLDRPTRAFAFLAGSYSLGVFNDNFFKQAACLLAVSLGLLEVQGRIVIAFTLPYLLLAAPAGWLADRFPKRNVVIACKGLEILAMVLGAVGIATGNWLLVMAMAFLMGLQSCLFSPSLNGSIPELFPPNRVTAANGRLKVALTSAILLGFVVAGVVLDLLGPMGVAGGVVLIAVGGLLFSLGAVRHPPADPHARYPWLGPIETLRELGRIARDGLLLRAVVVATFLWMAGQLHILLVNPVGKEQFGFGSTGTSLLLAAELIGLAAGGLSAGWLVKGPRWYRAVPAALAVMTVILAAVGFVPLLPGWMHYPALCILLAAGGAAGGLAMVPCEAFIQLRPPASRRGAVIAANNFANFAGMAVAGLVGNLLNTTFQHSRTYTHGFFVLAGLAAAVTLWSAWALRGDHA